ncbi:MAG: hypothetical protein A2Y63_04540 [Candidatus Riflebacteria bacterium RBG_13_59_9]|nr:MAG: hypothetical protein A2Y63_04540 [Candidatus Riflebacteria bacterium RBG_13_59_9]
MRLPRNSLAIVAAIAAMGCACGGIAPGLTTPGALAPPAGAAIAPQDAVTVIFHRQLDENTLPGNVLVTQEGADVPHACELRDEGYVLAVRPLNAWSPGELEIILVGGEDGLRYTDGRGFASITLTYFVGG